MAKDEKNPPKPRGKKPAHYSLPVTELNGMKIIDTSIDLTDDEVKKIVRNRYVNIRITLQDADQGMGYRPYIPTTGFSPKPRRTGKTGESEDGQG